MPPITASSRPTCRRIADYPRLSAYMERVLRLPGVRETVNLDHIKAGYYSIKALNPTGIVPAGPDHVTRLLEAVPGIRW